MKTMYFSPSTQEHNIYVGGGTEEGNMNARADGIQKKLPGIKIYRNKPTMTLTEVVRESNGLKPALHFALHTNAGGGHGVEALYDPRKPRSKALAIAMCRTISQALGIPNRGIKDGTIKIKNSKGKLVSKYYEIGGINKFTDAVIVELFFHDDPGEVAKYKKNIAKLENEIAYQLKVYFA